MTIGQLAQILPSCPQNMRVVVNGYEEGYDDLSPEQIWSGEALRSKNLRDALAAYFSDFKEKERGQLYRIPKYAVLAKALRQRFPSRGRGSAERPVHFDQCELLNEIRKVLNPLTGDHEINPTQDVHSLNQLRITP